MHDWCHLQNPSTTPFFQCWLKNNKTFPGSGARSRASPIYFIRSRHFPRLSGMNVVWCHAKIHNRRRYFLNRFSHHSFIILPSGQWHASPFVQPSNLNFMTLLLNPHPKESCVFICLAPEVLRRLRPFTWQAVCPRVSSLNVNWPPITAAVSHGCKSPTGNLHPWPTLT